MKGFWNEDYSLPWQEIVNQLKLDKRLYVAYGSNMDKTQMEIRCPGAKVLGRTYLENWMLTLPHYANIERSKGKRTPALIWEITSKNEKVLDRYEGYPECYDKIDIIICVDGKRMSAMAYVMTDEYKKCDKKPRSGYINQILQGYRDAGFDEAEFQPSETKC
ncbi:MAG TPA: gamma-glutamylcyclotransferase [Clostridiaceae bacterium]|nr:gamma-glutamylcyclotransferase [Clostridiaceae bacterium]